MPKARWLRPRGRWRQLARCGQPVRRAEAAAVRGRHRRGAAACWCAGWTPQCCRSGCSSSIRSPCRRSPPPFSPPYPTLPPSRHLPVSPPITTPATPTPPRPPHHPSPSPAGGRAIRCLDGSTHLAHALLPARPAAHAAHLHRTRLHAPRRAPGAARERLQPPRRHPALARGLTGERLALSSCPPRSVLFKFQGRFACAPP